MKYNSFSYIYPPRPATIISPKSLTKFESGFFAQPKLNGSSMVVFTNGKICKIYDRHKKVLYNFKMDIKEILSLHKEPGWLVLVGEYMNRSKKDENNTIWNQKFCLYDILVRKNKYLIKTTFKERQNILDILYPINETKPYLSQISENNFRMLNIYKDFKKVYDEITQYDMYEGLVLKMIDGKLEKGLRSNNNTKTQIKSRKSTKNYAY